MIQKLCCVLNTHIVCPCCKQKLCKICWEVPSEHWGETTFRCPKTLDLLEWFRYSSFENPVLVISKPG